MNKYICTATIKYTRQEVQLHINALKIALNNPQLTSYRGRYETLLKDMHRIDKQMYEAETDAVLLVVRPCAEAVVITKLPLDAV